MPDSRLCYTDSSYRMTLAGTDASDSFGEICQTGNPTRGIAIMFTFTSLIHIYEFVAWPLNLW